MATPVPAVAPPYRPPALSYVRAVAIWLIILAHWTHSRFPMGEMGRNTFFVLSGYLISGIVWRHEVYVGVSDRQLGRVGTFYARRALRILPPYFLALGLSALLPLATIRQHPGWFVLPAANLLFYRLQHWGEGLGHLWTLAVEEQFYLLWPLLLTLGRRRVRPLLVLAALGPLFRVLWSIWFGPGFVMVLLPANLDLFAVGALLRLTESWPRVQRLARLRWVLLSWAGWTGSWLLMHLLFGWATAWELLYPTVGAVAAALTLAWVQRVPAANLRPTGQLGRVAEWVGRRSYGCYLYHLLLVVFYQRAVYHLLPATVPDYVALRQFWTGPLPTVLLLAPTLLALAAASWAWVEAPLERLKTHLSYAK